MSVDLYGTIAKPVSLAAVIDAAQATMRELLALESVPAIEVFADPRYELGRLRDRGVRMHQENLATDLSLAAADHGCGAFLDHQIRMLEPGEPCPARFGERTRSSGPGTDFALQCERFMRQFARPEGWPRDISVA